jgi:septal ring factor EnvC (AmiA/AmiB activator)
MDWLSAFWSQVSDRQEVLKLVITVSAAAFSAIGAVLVAHAWRTTRKGAEELKKITVEIRKSGRRVTFQDRRQLELKLDELEEEIRVADEKLREAQARLQENRKVPKPKQKRRRT